jgi:serine phosphatase RsbU (regulator of sigma subunit)
VKKLRVIVLLLFFALAGFSQEGNYYITNFTPSNYGASDQNWSVVQDSLGRVYVANLNGVMMYDGKFWKITNIEDDKEATSLAKAGDGTIYYGGGGVFGFISLTDSGKLKHNSLSKSLPEKEKEFGNVWAVHAIGRDVFFCANERIFWFQDKQFKKSFTPTGEKFHTFFKVNNMLLVREQGVGLLFFKDGALKKIMGSGELAETRVYSVLPVDENLYWLCSRNGLYTLFFNSNKPEISNLSRTPCPLDQWMIENDIYCGTKINGNLYALGSLKKGVILVNKNYQVINQVNIAKGLQDDAVKYIYKDYAGNVWLALNKGVSYAEINTPLTHWSKTNGIQGVIEAVAKFNGVPYIATDKGVEKLNTQTNSFESIDIAQEAWDLRQYGDVLLAGTNIGLFEITPKGSKMIFESGDGVFKIFGDPKKPELLYLAGLSTITIAQYRNHQVKPIKTFENAFNIRSAASDTHGQIFFGSLNSVVYSLPPGRMDTLLAYDAKDSLPEGFELYVFPYNDKVLACTGLKGIYSYSGDAKQRFKPLFRLESINNKPQITKAVQFEQDIWIASVYNAENNAKVDELSVLRKTEQGFVQDYKLLKRIRELAGKSFLVDSDKVFIGTNDGLIEYNTRPIENNFQFYTFISKITQGVDTGGIQNYAPGFTFREPEISYNKNDIRFFAAASDFYDKNELEFAFYLEGKDTDYSEWSKNNRFAFSGLHEGHYVIHIKSKNILGAEGKPVSFAFTILPPWYRTYWAYALYLVGSIGLIWFIVQYNTRRLKEQNIKLENIIAERTKEIEHQKEEIEHKNQEITDSINYAQRIQQAILPPVNEIIRVWPDTFVFYQPKDIVSGDFYWFNRISDHEMLIACADCTGHGVPGGFMSMICSDKLTDAVKLTHDPEKILFHVNNNVKKALRQTETADANVNKDGMEISLVRFDFKAKKVWYAGANRPLWILKSGSEEIEEVKPTKASIASFTQPDFEYQGHEIQLAENDLVYMTSDGYPDQFGGPEGKKFMTKNFKKLLLSIKQLGIREQESTVRNAINQWKEGYEQVDDLLVIGCRL